MLGELPHGTVGVTRDARVEQQTMLELGLA
jgi:hypothetical protein